MYAHHQSTQRIATPIESELPNLLIIASVSEAGELRITIANQNWEQELCVPLQLHGACGTCKSTIATTLVSSRNVFNSTFTKQVVVLAIPGDGKLNITIPAFSVMQLAMQNTDSLVL